MIKQLFKTNVKNGIMGTFHFDRNGDTVPLKWISFDQLRGKTRAYAVRGRHQGQGIRARIAREHMTLGKGPSGPFPS